MKNNIFGLSLLFLVPVLLSSSCNSGSEEQQSDNTSDSLAVNVTDSVTEKQMEVVDFKFFMAYANLPSPFNVVNDLYQFKAPYRKELLNPVQNASRYVRSFSKEINFGIYGVDLAYINFYGSNQNDADVYKLVHDFAKEMNIESVVNDYEQRYKDNSDNVDSLVAIMDNIYADVDDYLRKSERYSVASNIMAGSMVEVCYLSLNLLKDLPLDETNAVLYEKVHNENTGIYHLIKLYEEYPDKDSKALLAGLKDYKSNYDALIKSPQDLAGQNLDKVITLISKLRNNLTS